MADNKLKLNDDKTLALLLRTPSLGPQPDISGLTIGNTFISWYYLRPAPQHGGPCQKCLQLFFLPPSSHRRIRDVLDIRTAATIVQDLVISRLDKWNSLLYGLPSTLINRPQRVQNAAAKVVARAGRREHITLVRFQLHWLSVQYRITLKILLLTHTVRCIVWPLHISPSCRPRIDHLGH